MSDSKDTKYLEKLAEIQAKGKMRDYFKEKHIPIIKIIKKTIKKVLNKYSLYELVPKDILEERVFEKLENLDFTEEMYDRALDELLERYEYVERDCIQQQE